MSAIADPLIQLHLSSKVVHAVSISGKLLIHKVSQKDFIKEGPVKVAHEFLVHPKGEVNLMQCDLSGIITATIMGTAEEVEVQLNPCFPSNQKFQSFTGMYLPKYGLSII